KVAADMELRRPKASIAGRGAAVLEEFGAPEVWARAQQTLVHWWKTAAGEVKVWVPVSVGTLVVAMLTVMRLGGWKDSGPRNASVPPVQSQQTAPTHASVHATTSSKQATGAKTTQAEKTFAVAKAPVKPLVTRTQAPSPSTSAPRKPAPLVAVPGQLARTLPSPKPAEQPAAAAAMLTISTNPPGADIEIDGAFVGNAPSTISVGPGSHLVSVRKNGYLIWSKVLSVTGGNIHLNAELEPQIQPLD
ncbi:MAG TPA: PEGA domain-containing protein, partial [Terracidiphilus sp.]